MASESRRNLLRSLGAGSSAILLSSLPDKWTRPVVDSVVLPAHGQMSPTTCSAGSITSTNNDENVVILFDGESNCSLTLVAGADGGDSGDPDEMLLIDNDAPQGTPTPHFELDGPQYGSNWSNDGPTSDDNPAGDYSYTRTRVAGPNAGVDFEVSFTVSFPGGDEMVVSDVTITTL